MIMKHINKILFLITPFLLLGTTIGCSSTKEQEDTPVTPDVIPDSPILYTTNPFDEPFINKQVYLNSLGDIYSVWQEYRGDNVTLAVIDDGFDINHPEFKDEKGNSKISDKSASFTYSNGSVAKKVGVSNCGINEYKNSHGTFCASIATGSISGTGTVGIAPNATLMLLKVDNRPKSICEAFKYAADNGARVISISIGSYDNYNGDLVNDGSDLKTVFNSAVEYAYNKGVVICSAAGNGGYDYPTRYTYPGAVNHIIGCGGIAYNEDETVWSGSSYNESNSKMFCDIFAPSENMYSGAYLNNKSTYDGGWEGTSFSAPIVAGAAALYFNKYPTKTNADFENDLYRTAVSMADSKNTGHGRIDIGALLGETKTNEISINFIQGSTWSQDNCISKIYLWNSKTGANNSWPGVNYSTSMKINLSQYDKAIISRWTPSGVDGNARTINLSLYAFNYVSGYKIEGTDIWYNNNNPQVGTYIK